MGSEREGTRLRLQHAWVKPAAVSCICSTSLHSRPSGLPPIASPGSAEFTVRHAPVCPAHARRFLFQLGRL